MRDTIIRMFKAGVAVKAIADATGTPQTAIIAVLARENLWREGEEAYKDSLVGPAVRQGVLLAYRDYAPVEAVCKRYGITSQQFWQIVATEGEPTRHREPLIRHLSRMRRNDEIVAMYEAGEKVKEIARVCGISKVGLYRVLHKRGVVPDRHVF